MVTIIFHLHACKQTVHMSPLQLVVLTVRLMYWAHYSVSVFLYKAQHVVMYVESPRQVKVKL